MWLNIRQVDSIICFYNIKAETCQKHLTIEKVKIGIRIDFVLLPPIGLLLVHLNLRLLRRTMSHESLTMIY